MYRKQNDIKVNPLLENQIMKEWTPILEATGLLDERTKKDPTRMSMIAKIAHVQQTESDINESFLNENSSFDNAGFTTLSAQPGLGNPSFGTTLGGQNAFTTGAPGSGDKWISPFKISLQIAAKTIGFDIVSTIPITAPTGMVYYLDYIYADGKIDGTGNDSPKIFKIVMPSTFTANATKGDTFVAFSDGALATGGAGTGNSAKLTYVGQTRVSGAAIFKLTGMGTAAANVVTETSTLKLADVFDGSASIVSTVTNSATANTLGTVYAVTTTADFVKGFEDHIYGFSGGAGGQDAVVYEDSFTDGQSLYEGARRGESEGDRFLSMTQKVTNKNIETMQFKVSVEMTQEQLRDMKRQHGWDLIQKSESALVDQASQNINRNILARTFALGWAHHINAKAVEGVNHNVSLDSAYTSGNATVTYIKNDGTLDSMTIPGFQTYSTSTAGFENQETIQRRIVSKIFAASDLIQIRGKRGPGTGIVTNAQIATAIRNVKGYIASPFANNINANSLYPMGTIDGMPIFVDPGMKYNDTRVCVFRKGQDDDPGLKFMPYLLGETVQTIVSETMAPKIALTSSYALVDFGQNPELQYFTFYVKVPAGGIN